MSYSTPDLLKQFVDRLSGTGSRTVLQWGQSGSAQDANIQLALAAASGALDAAADLGGFTTPITQTSLGCTDDQWAKNEARLQVCEMTLALSMNLFPADLTKQMKEAAGECREFLKQLARGEGLLSGSASPGGNFALVTTTSTPPVTHWTLSANSRVSFT